MKPISTCHRTKRVEWARRYMKTDFWNVLFTDECRATLDNQMVGPPVGYSLDGKPELEFVISKVTEGNVLGRVMFWAGIKGDTIIGPFKVEAGVKIDSQSYCELLKIFQQYNASAPRLAYTSDWLKKAGFDNERVMIWLPNGPDLNPMENFGPSSRDKYTAMECNLQTWMTFRMLLQKSQDQPHLLKYQFLLIRLTSTLLQSWGIMV